MTMMMMIITTKAGLDRNTTKELVSVGKKCKTNHNELTSVVSPRDLGGLAIQCISRRYGNIAANRMPHICQSSRSYRTSQPRKL